MVYDLLIIYKGGTEKIVHQVRAHGVLANEQCFYFDKNGYRAFVPIEVVTFFGRAFDYDND